jgi:hypothetical protein
MTTVRSPLRDYPPFDEAVPIPDAAFIPYESDFGAIAILWRDWRTRRRGRRQQRRADARARRRAAARSRR